MPISTLYLKKLHILSIIISTSCFLFIFPVTAQSPNLYFQHLNSSDGLSNNRVNCIIQNKQGYLWIATLDGLNRYDGYNFKIFKSHPEDQNIHQIRNNRILKLYEDKKGNIWMGANKRSGIECYNPYTNTFRFYSLIKQATDNLDIVDVNEFCEKNDTLYIRLNKEIYYLDEANDSICLINKTNIFKPDTLLEYYEKSLSQTLNTDVEVYCYLHEKNGTTWVGTRRNGLFINEHGTFKLYSKPPLDASFEIRTLFQDASGVIWIGTRNNGLYKHYPPSRAFKHYNYFEKEDELIYDLTVRAIAEDSQENIWIGTYNNGLLKFNRNGSSFEHIHLGENITCSDNKIRSLLCDKEDNIWIGSYNGITIYHNHQSDKLPVETDDEHQNVPYNSQKLFGKRVYGLTLDSLNNIWIAGWHALSYYNTKSKQFRHYPASYFGVRNIRKVFIDSHNTIWVGCEFGGLIQFNPVNENFKRFFPDNDHNSLVCENIFDIHETNDKKIWIATFNGLDEYDPKNDKFTHYFTNNGLCSNMIYGILEDNNNNLWFTTSNGISKYNLITRQFNNYDGKSGLLTSEYAEGGYYKSRNSNEFIIGGINGFQVFNPDSISSSASLPTMVVNKVKIMNQTIGPGKQYTILNPLSQEKHYDAVLTLAPEDKMVTFEFSALHYAIPEKNRYQYMLEGFDNDWVTSSALQRSATYTNLWPGEYTFKVIGANAYNQWTSKPYIIKVTVLPPFWLSWWAFIIYAGIVVLSLLLYRYYTLRKVTLKNALAMEKIKLQEAERINETKMNFFTNISHEFRTPLTLILAPLERVMDSSQNTPLKDFHKQFKIMANNTRKLIDLTNQVLDLRKIESSEQILRPTKINIVDFVQSVVNQFLEEALLNNIKLIYEFESNMIDADVDVQMFERVLYNLLSNALKFSNRSQGYVTIKVGLHPTYTDDQYACIIGKINSKNVFEINVQDNGIGIDTDEIDKIFDRFYRIDNEKTNEIYGSGVGLSLLKEIVLLHKGQILVKSKTGEGTVFSIRLPLIQKNTHTENIAFPKPKLKPYIKHEFPIPQGKEISGRKNILLIDDNTELLAYIKNIFEAYYNVYTANNGKTAIQLTFSKKIHLIISDIAMPSMSGIEMCKYIKNDVRTCHIPIILLTARTNNEYKSASFEALADDYIEKPFNVKLLLKSVKRLLLTRQKIKEALLEGNLMTDKDPLPSTDNSNHNFLIELDSYLQKNLIDSNLNVAKISQEMGISRSSLHNKLKNLSGLSASEYIRNKRVIKAAQMLKEKRLSVLEIAYQTGFSSSSYFIKCFRQKYGVTPKEYMEQ